MIDLDELRKLAAAATPGEWSRVEPPWLPSDVSTYVIAGSDDSYAGLFVCDFGIADDGGNANDWNDAGYIVAACNSVPMLLDEIDRLRAELASAQLSLLRAKLGDLDEGEPPPELFADAIRGSEGKDGGK